MTKQKNKWIQKAHLKQGALSRQLGIPIKENIPKSLLIDIITSDIGDKVMLSYEIINTNHRGKYIKVTKLLKRRAQLALNLKNIKRR